jgi:hypothetical protein
MVAFTSPLYYFAFVFVPLPVTKHKKVFYVIYELRAAMAVFY